MTKNEFALALIAAKYIKRYHDCNPEVGMGIFNATILKDLERWSGVKLDKEKLLERMDKE